MSEAMTMNNAGLPAECPLQLSLPILTKFHNFSDYSILPFVKTEVDKTTTALIFRMGTNLGLSH